jgi:hypothetical protein
MPEDENGRTGAESRSLHTRTVDTRSCGHAVKQVAMRQLRLCLLPMRLTVTEEALLCKPSRMP